MTKDMRQRTSGPLSGESSGTTGRLRPTAPPQAATTSSTGLGSQAQPALSKLSPSEFNTAMVHFYRGEITRSNTWRNRLDTTTNWAVITAGATLSFAFGDPFSPHFVILINSLLVAFFLLMEARRYRYYEIWSSRVRVVETGYFAQILSTEGTADRQWAEHLSHDLMTPHFTISEWEAIGRRLRRNYLWIFVLLAASWNLKVYLHPVRATDFSIFVDRATIGVVPGPLVLAAGVVFNAGLIIFAIATVRLREATGEVLPHHDFSFRPLQRMTEWTRAATQERRTRRRAQRARQRVRTTSTLTATGEFKRLDTTETPDRKPITEEILK
ncbi:MAG: DUF2270 domain-containing protein [Pyrinomonadaceae bacterium]|nr:DUF2270 domain-containing protein [Pyrinomonadaceae bacterium]